MPIIAENLSYIFPQGKRIIHDVNFSIAQGGKVGLVGDNGSGKSTLLRILTGAVSPQTGSVHLPKKTWFVPQHVGQFDTLNVAEALLINHKTDALRAIENGSVDPIHHETLADDWTIHERLKAALGLWGLSSISWDTPFNTLSGGEKTRVFLSGLDLHSPDLILLDEPTNHLDRVARKKLHQCILNTRCTVLIVSHDRELLNVCNQIYELSSAGIQSYGGNYTFYSEQKKVEMRALSQQIEHTKKEVSAARKKYQETMQNKQKMDSRSAKMGKTKNLPKIIKNARNGQAELSTAKLNDIHKDNIQTEKEKLRKLTQQERTSKQIKISLDSSSLHTGKYLFEANRINVAWPSSDLIWENPLSFIITSGDRLRISGNNGSGKTTLIHLLTRQIYPCQGNLEIHANTVFLLDQEYSLINKNRSVLEQAQASNEIKKEDHQLKTLLHRFLFDKEMWNQSCHALSGGEMMRLSLCCLALQSTQPDVIILDEPTNNLDLNNIRVLTKTIAEYRGTLLVVSHDNDFISEVGIENTLHLS